MHRIRAAEGVVGHEVESELERLFNLSTDRVAISFVGVGHVDDAAVASGLAAIVDCR